MATTTELTAKYDQALAQFSHLLANVRPEQISARTPCPDWDVRALVSHIIWMNEFVVNGVPPADGGDEAPTVDDLRARFDASADGLRATFLTPGGAEKIFHMPWGEVTGWQLMSLSLLEHAIHGWDLAKATGQLDALDPELYAVALDQARVVMANVARGPGHNLGDEVAVPDDASPIDRLAAFYGRQP